MKTLSNKTGSEFEEELAINFNWSERTAMFISTKKNNHQFRLVHSLIDLIAMVVTASAMVNCL